MERSVKFCWRYPTKGRGGRGTMEIAEHLTGLNVSSFHEMLSCTKCWHPFISPRKWRFWSIRFSKQTFAAVCAEAKQKCLLDRCLRQIGIINDVTAATQSPVLQLNLWFSRGEMWHEHYMPGPGVGEELLHLYLIAEDPWKRELVLCRRGCCHSGTAIRCRSFMLSGGAGM